MTIAVVNTAVASMLAVCNASGVPCPVFSALPLPICPSSVLLVQNIKLVEKVDEIAKAKGVEPGQLALAWVHTKVFSQLPT